MSDETPQEAPKELPASMRDATPTPAEELRNIRMAVITFGIIVSVLLITITIMMIPLLDHVTGAYDERNGGSSHTLILP